MFMRCIGIALLSVACARFAPVAAQELSTTSAWSFDSELLRPFWQGELMIDEPVLFIRDSRTGEARAEVLFPVKKIVAVRNSAKNVTYEEGRDYRWERDSRSLILPEHSRITTSLLTDLRRPSGSQKYKLLHRDGKEEIRFGAKLEYNDLQTCITYEHAPNLWKIPPPKFDATALPSTLTKLHRRQPLSVVVIGDSISTGCNASGWAKEPPYQPAYPELVKLNLEANYRADVHITNLAVDGQATPWAVTMVDKINAAKPDLVIIAFGVNDAHGRSTPEYQSNIQTVIEKVRAELPRAEFILVATLIGNPDWIALKQELFPQYRDALRELTGNGVALADVTSIWGEFHRLKNDRDHTGNGVNHPNDFGHRVYAQVVSALLIPSDKSDDEKTR